MRSQRKGAKSGEQFFSASHFVHVRPMFEVAWIPFLAGLSGPLQAADDLEIVELCLDGFKSAIRIVCFFDLELERNAFVTTLAKFTFLNNLGEMKPKNMEAIKALLDVAVTEGNNLKGSWREVLTCVSQLEHMQLIGSGVDVPDLKKGCVNNCLIRALIEYFIAVVAVKSQRKSWQTRVAQPILRWLPTWYSPSVITCLE
jgi:brefeldin A-inhibited guanine nucleotide-exchange protein